MGKLAKPVPVGGIDVGFVEDAADRTDRHFVLLRNDYGIDDLARAPDEFDVAAPGACLDESRGQAALDFTKR